MLLRHLPILELHTPTPPPTLDFFENLDDFSMTPGAITSLYFDCPSNDLPLYHDRVALKEGANLLRIRWCVFFLGLFLVFVVFKYGDHGAVRVASRIEKSRETFIRRR